MRVNHHRRLGSLECVCQTMWVKTRRTIRSPTRISLILPGPGKTKKGRSFFFSLGLKPLVESLPILLRFTRLTLIRTISRGLGFMFVEHQMTHSNI